MNTPLPDRFVGAFCPVPKSICSWLVVCCALLVLEFPTRAATEIQRRDHLGWMLKNLPDAPAWREWQQKTGA